MCYLNQVTAFMHGVVDLTSLNVQWNMLLKMNLRSSAVCQVLLQDYFQYLQQEVYSLKSLH